MFYRSAILLIAVLIGLIAFSAPAFADHEPDHRYFISGKVTDKDNKPWAGEKVIVSDPTAGITETTRTDSGGNYQVKLHLHDNNLGDEVTVQAGGTTKSHKVSFTVGDKTSERRGIVNVVTDSAAKSNVGPLGGNLPYLIGLVFILGIASLIFFTYPRSGKAAAKAKAGSGSKGATKIRPKRKGASKSKKR